MINCVKNIISILREGVRRRGYATLSDLHTIELLLKKCPRDARLWCIRGNLIELSEENTTYELRDALASYKRAILIGPNYVESYIDAGYYHFYVRDDPFRAVLYFKRAMNLESSRQLVNIYREAQKEISERKHKKSHRGLTRRSPKESLRDKLMGKARVQKSAR